MSLSPNSPEDKCFETRGRRGPAPHRLLKDFHSPQKGLPFRAENERSERGKAWFPKRWQNTEGQGWRFLFPLLNPCRCG